MPYKLQRRNNKKQKWTDTEYIIPFTYGKYTKGAKHKTKLGASFDKKVTSLMNKGVEIRIVKTRKKRKGKNNAL